MHTRKIQAQVTVLERRWSPERPAAKFQGQGSAEDTPSSLGPRPAFCPWNRFSWPVLHCSPLRPFSFPPLSQSWLTAGHSKPARSAPAGPRGRTLPPGLAVGGRVLRRGVAAAGPRQRSPPGARRKVRPRPPWRCSPCAPGSPRHSPGRSRAGCSDTECGPGRSRPRRRRPGRSAEPWLRWKHWRAPRPPDARSPRTGRCGTLRGWDRPGPGRGGAAATPGTQRVGLQRFPRPRAPPPATLLPASRAARLPEPPPPLRRPAAGRQPVGFPAPGRRPAPPRSPEGGRAGAPPPVLDLGVQLRPRGHRTFATKLTGAPCRFQGATENRTP